MAVSRMLKVQILGHTSIKEAVKRFLRETGVVEVTDVSTGQEKVEFDETDVRGIEGLMEKTNASIRFLEGYSDKLSLFERLQAVPAMISSEEIEKLSRDTDVEDIWQRCSDLESTLRNSSDDFARSREVVRSLEPWKDVGIPLESLSTEGYEVQFWTLPEKSSDIGLGGIVQRFDLAHFEECGREGGRSHIAVLSPKGQSEEIGEALKELEGFRSVFENLRGTPAEVIASQRESWSEFERVIEGVQKEARELAAIKDSLLLLLDYYGELLGLMNVERHFHLTESCFVLEGWVRGVERRRLQRDLVARFEEIEIFFRPPQGDEEPPIYLENRPLAQPYEFVTTLYGRPGYRESDPTPLLAPFFILFFAMCLTDAGYGLTLAALSAIVLVRLKPAGGTGNLMRLLFMGGIITTVVGVLAGGIFGIEPESLPGFIQQFIFINPLQEPMKMLNISFVMGLVHMLFGMGIRMVANFRARLIADAILDNMLWIFFLIALAPLGYTAILGGELPIAVSVWSKRASMVIAACIFLSGGRRQKGIVGKIFKGLVGFYDVVGYFGDVLSYARLLALGLATSAIAIAINDIAAMVTGWPFYTGYIAAVLVLVAGHAFNLAVNSLGAFVHSGRLQYLEFFSKFFNGGGREFRPFRSERRYSAMKETEIGS